VPNTVIQIKRSSSTATPTNGSLAAAEQAYSFNSDKLFIGNTNGTGVVEIGGKYWVDTTIAAFAQANAAFGAANTGLTDGAAFTQANTARDHAHAAFAQANAAPGIANSYATSVGTAGNNYTIAVGAASNGRANIVGTAGNNYTNAVVVAGNAYTTFIGIVGNNYTTAVGTAGNNFATAVGTAGNAYTNAVGTAGNNYSIVVGASANAWSNTINSFATSTFVRLTSPSQTITGNLSIVGSLTISGNTTIIDTENLRVTDPLIYLAGNNYLSDIVDIGFIANYVNATGSNVHTGLYREHVDKQYYLFQSYDAEPANNHIGALSNNMTLAVLNADLKTSNLTLGGANAILLIASAFDKANAANVLAFNTGIGANAYATAVGAAANAWSNNISAAVGTAGNNYAIAISTAGNNYATFIGTVGNNYTTAVGTAGNNYTNALGTAGNNYSIAVGAAANAWSNTISSTRALSSNAYAEAIGAAANTASRDASRINTGLLTVPFGGTAMTSFTQNGILFGNTAGALKVTSAGTEGQVLQASSTGVPQFAMLDGGGF